MFRLENPGGTHFENFLRAQGPLRIRFAETIAEQGESACVWVDDLIMPRMAINASSGWLAPLGRPGAVLSRLEEMERISARLGGGGGHDEHASGGGCAGTGERVEESADYLKLASVAPAVQGALRRRRKVIRESPVGMFVLERRDFNPVGTSHRIERLKDGDAETLVQNSPYGEERAYSLARIQNAPTAAIRIRGALASYMVVHANGSLGMLHTMARFRGQGLARAVVSALVEKQFARGRAAYCYVVAGNASSERVFERLGFRKAMDVYWSVFERGEL